MNPWLLAHCPYVAGSHISSLYTINNILRYMCAMNGENWLLVTDEPIELEKYLVEVSKTLSTKMSQLGHYETIYTLGMCIENVVHEQNPWKWLHWQGLECLSWTFRILHGYSLVPTSHHYVPIMFLTLNWADQLAHFSW